MAENKTKAGKSSVEDFLNKLEDVQQHTDALAILDIMKKVSGHEPVMWGDSIIGFGNYHYKYGSGREGDWFETGFSPRKKNITVYVIGYLFDKYPHLLEGLGKFKSGKGCLYISKLSDINPGMLEKIIRASVDWVRKEYRQQNP